MNYNFATHNEYLISFQGLGPVLFIFAKIKFFGYHAEFFRCPRLENARSILQNDLHEIPEIILIHTGTNDLTAILTGAIHAMRALI